MSKKFLIIMSVFTVISAAMFIMPDPIQASSEFDMDELQRFLDTNDKKEYDFETDPEYWADWNLDAGGNISTLGGLIQRLNSILNTIVPFIVGLGVFVVIWGIFKYISQSAEEEKRHEARQFILWGVIFIFLMLSVWGLVNVLDNSFSLRKDAVPVGSVFPERN